MDFDELLERYEPRLAAAFRECIEAIKSAIVLKAVVERLQRGDIYGAIKAIQIESEVFSALEIALQEAFNAGGVSMVESLPKLVAPDGTRVLFQFGVRNLEAEALLRSQSSGLVTRITDDQREALRIAFESGLSRGQNPTATALEVVGRISRVTGRREGGLIGLTSRQVEFISRARESLLAGDVDGMRRYLELKTRDRRFDRTVAKAIRDGKPVPPDMVAKLIARLSDRNLLLRGQTIALEETRTALFTVRDNAIRQQIQAGKIAAQDVTKHWQHSGSEHPRLQHIEMAARYKAEGVPLDQPFIAADGTPLMYPHDPKAPARHTIGCRCRMSYDIDYVAAGLRKYRARTA
ncbi:head morphogenesis protein [Rhizobium alvei]|uniref:Head morphogenesis protein n=1 Tax=Rhizobium alvei TaxID=1132659 RepID=A0ABT8YUL4_9HYPH|nr:head morphogenesis protein [Rhizobium alvei]MDO6966982.1 head morphogenesis protein [Rhizobium alvei]